jgi:quinol-cytochrome oxidoreductase complex cytochrome b subunit
MSSEPTPKTALRVFAENLRAAPGEIYRSLFRGGRPVTDRSRSTFVFNNVFLHLHAVRTHLWSLRWRTTLGLGTAALAAFLVTLVTGVLLMFYYKPYPDAAYQSIKDIHFVVPTGRFIRNIHRWAANIMVITVILHMARVFYTAAYRQARQFNWLIGIVLLATTLGLSFTGYLLPWDQLAYWAITIGANIAQSPREVTDALGITQSFDPGGLQRQLLLGSDVVGEEALIRFDLLHVMVLPLLLTGLLAVHFWRIRKDGGLARPDDADERVGREKGTGTFCAQHPKGRSGKRCLSPFPDRPAPSRTYPVFTEAPAKTYQLAAIVRGRTAWVSRSPEKTVPSMPHLFYAELAVLMLTVLVCLGLALVADAPLKELANPDVPENPAKAPWYFLGLQELVSFSAFMGGTVIPAIALLGLGLIPFLDREESGTGRWFGGPGGWRLVLQAAIFGTAATLAVEAIAIRYGWLREWFPGIPQLVITFINPGTILTALYAVYSLWIVRHYNSTRAGALGLFTCFLCGFVLLTVIGTYFRGPNWAFYWSPADWPKH